MKKQLHETNYTAYQPHMLLDFTFSFDKDIAHDDICRTVVEVVEEVNLNRYIDLTHRNIHGYDAVMLFKLVLLAWAEHGYASTRCLERLCRTDVRYMFISQNQKPSHMVFQRFLHDDLKMNIDTIFYEINKYMEKKVPINVDVLCIDGTKYEANANKYTFVWRANTERNRKKCWKKAIEIIHDINNYFKRQNLQVMYSSLREPSIEYLLAIADRIEKYMKHENIEFVHGKGKKKSEIQRIYDKLKVVAIKLWEYCIHLELLGNRNSFSKTDPDATFMHMKYDYYNHTNVFKPGYNIQIGVSDGFIRNIYISGDANDVKTYIPFMEKYKAAYGKLPKRTPGDAGYGSYENYAYCKENQMDLLMKFSGYYKKKEKKSEKNQFLKSQMKRTEEGGFICPAGHEFDVEKVVEDKRSDYGRINTIFVNHHCEHCPLRSKCTKSSKGRTIIHSFQLEEYQEEVTANVTSEEGIELMHQRSNEAEGTFGDWKENHKYDRLRRRGEDGVKLEITLVAIGHNLRKYHRLKIKLQKEAEKEKAVN